jgi:DNA-binding transcriptional ArsR family regulator
VTDSPAGGDLTPDAERVISDVETLKALSDPVRLRILETMVQASDEDWTVKRIASALEVGPTKLYHHVQVLEERGLIRVAGTRVVSGIIETRYRIAQLSVRLDRALLSASAPPDEAGAAVGEIVRTIFDTAREDAARAASSGAMELEPGHGDRPSILRQDIKRLTASRASEFRERLSALLDEFDSGNEEPDGAPFGLLVALYPVVDPRHGATREHPDD